MWIDTHCHLDAAEFDADRDLVAERARAAGVETIVIPTTEAASFARTRECAHAYGCAYTLGIHPLYVENARDEHLDLLRRAIEEALPDPQFVGVGEIGLDAYAGAPDFDLQEKWFTAQLALAAEFSLPCVVHVRKAVDRVIWHIRRSRIPGGIAHAFNGSLEQALALYLKGFRVGFGGSCTYDGSRRIRSLAARLPSETFVLETDAPDIPPQWRREPGASLRNEPFEIATIAEIVALLREVTTEELARIVRKNSFVALPRLSKWLASQAVQRPS